MRGRVNGGGVAMLTLEQLDIYEAFGGDVDAWARAGGRGAMCDADWRLIDELRQGLQLVASGLATAEFAAGVAGKLRAAAASEQVRARLQGLSAGR